MKLKEDIKLEEMGIRGLYCEKCGEWHCCPFNYQDQKYFAIRCDCTLEETGFEYETTNLTN